MLNYSSLQFPSYKKFFGLAFIFSILIAIFFQKIVLPLSPDMHAGFGLLKNDAIVFHNAAIELARKIQSGGWENWSLYTSEFSGNVTILSIIYNIFGPYPVLFLPITAALHALSATLIYRIGFKLTQNDTGKIAGLIAGICFVSFPSTLQWYGQNHKDTFAIAGTLILLETWLTIISLESKDIYTKKIFALFLSSIAGVALIGMVRPHQVSLIALGFLSSFIIVNAIHVFESSYSLKYSLKTGIFVVFIFALGIGFTHIGNSDRVFSEFDEQGNRTYELSKNFHWQSSTYLPKAIDERIKRAAELRVHFAEFNLSVGANTNIDTYQLPNSATEVAKYLPRALSIGLFSPFPETWDDRVTVTRLVGAIETCVWYLFFIGTLITLRKHANPRVFACVAFVVPIIIILAFIHPNIGTLYRQRYCFWQIFLLLGAIGWSTLLMQFLNKEYVSNLSIKQNSNKPALLSKSKLMSAGFVVTLITTCCYLGFFARDLIIINNIGLNHRLDAFFTAMMIPMFFVTCLAMPIGDSATRLFVSENSHLRKQNLIDTVVSWSFFWLLVITLLVVVFAEDLVGLIINNDLTSIEEAAALLRLFSPILLLSAWTMTGNAILNSLGQQKEAAVGQLITPATVITCILLSSQDSILTVSVVGMLMGMTFNILWIIRHLQLQNFQLMPKLVSFEVIKPLLQNYGKLVLSALFPALLTPVNYAFAASVGEGNLSAWGFSSKIVLLFTGIATVVTTSVLLPYFSSVHYSQTNHHPYSKVPLRLAIAIGGCITFICFIFIEPIVAITVGKDSNEVKIQELINIIQIGLIQIPIMIGITVFNKQAIAGNRASSLLISSVITFTINLLGNWLLVPRIGVTGVAISALAGVLAGFVFFYSRMVFPKR
jgi:putative peptidoglycan lipid II flippase